MSYRLRWTPEANQTFQELRRAAEQAQQRRAGTAGAGSEGSEQRGPLEQVAKAVRLLAENPRHPGLSTHQYQSLVHPFDDQGEVFEACAQNLPSSAHRVFWCFGPEQGEITIIAITPHP